MSAKLAEIVFDIFLNSLTPKLVYIGTERLSLPPTFTNVPKNLDSNKEKLEKMFSKVN